MKRFIFPRVSSFMNKPLFLLLLLGLAQLSFQKAGAEDVTADVVIYKASPGGITAALAAAREGAPVVLVEPTRYVGGIIAQGALGASDVAAYTTIGGLSRNFFQRVGDYYEKTYGADSQQLRDSLIGSFKGGQLEPKVGELVFEQLLKDQPAIRVIRQAPLIAVDKKGTSIVSLTCGEPSGKGTIKVSGKVFIDASYCGDLLAAAKVSYLLGSESREKFHESMGRDKDGPQIQAFNYRLPLTCDPTNRIAITKPEGYDPKKFESYLRNMDKRTFPPGGYSFQYHLPNQKLDCNFSDMPGFNWSYPEATLAAREEIERRQRANSLGYFYFLQNDPRVPQAYHDAVSEWGLCKDEFADNGHFAREIYVREGRRLNGVYVVRQSDLQQTRYKDDSIAIGSISIDLHATQPTAKAGEGQILPNGGGFQPVRPYDIPYRCLVPKPEECTNLLVPVCLAATHVAWGSIRMEPVFMMTGEAAGLAAALAVAEKIPVQKVPIATLQAALTKYNGLLHAAPEPIADFEWEPKHPKPGEPVHFRAKQVEGSPVATSFHWNFDGTGHVDSESPTATWTFKNNKATLVTLAVSGNDKKPSSLATRMVPVGDGTAGDVEMDSEDNTGVECHGIDKSAGQIPYYGTCFYHDGKHDKGGTSVIYSPKIAQAGNYSLYISSVPARDRSTKTLVEVTDAQGKKEVRVDQSNPGPLFGLIHVGDFNFAPDQPPKITISNADTDGYVVFDEIRLILNEKS